MKRKMSIYLLSIIVLMGIVFITSDYTYADNFDFYYYNNEIDYNYYDVLNNDTIYYRLINNYDKCFQEFEQHYYNLKEISDYRVENRDATTEEVMANINKYLATELGTGRDLIDNALSENALNNPKEFYTDDSYDTYKEAYDHIIAFKDNRFIIKEDLLDSIETMEIAYLNLTPREVDKSKLEALIQVAETFSSDDFTYESYMKLEEALQVANSVLSKEDATQLEVEEATDKLRSSILNLRKNVINDYVVTYKMGNEIIGTEVVKEGDNPTKVPLTDKEGYTFSHWTWNGVDYSSEEIGNIEVAGNIDFQAVMIPRSDYTYRINYLDNNNNNELSESLLVENQVYGTEVEVKGTEISGYYLENDTITFTIGENNEVNFIYIPRTDIEYTVRFIANGEEIKEATIKHGEYKSENEVEVIKIPGYNPVKAKATIFINQLENNEITLEYRPREDIPYTVEHIERLSDGSERVIGDSNSLGTFKEEITIKAVEYRGLVTDTSTITIILDNLDNNLVKVYYYPDPSITYTIKYTNRQGDEWSVNLPAEYQNEVTAEDIKEIEIIKDNQRYKIEKIDKELIIIDDKSENNLFRINVYKVYPISEHQDLMNILENSNSLTRPNYSHGNIEWDLYWNQLIEAKDEFQNTFLTEDNIEVIKGNLVESIEVIKSIKDFDLAWGDRETPLGFAETINRQAQSPDYFGRLKVYFNRYTNTITIGMSDEQKDKSFAGGALGVGVRTAMINVLKSESLYTVQSRGVEAEIRDSNGNIYSETELINRGIELAYAWLPEGMSPFNNIWGELIGIEPVEFIMKGKTTPNGEVFTRTYYFEFVDINDI